MSTDISPAVHPLDAASLVARFPTAPRLLALGEPTHRDESLLGLRNELFRDLVDHGYRTIAIESDCLRGLAVDEFVAGGDGVLDDVVAQGFSHGWGDLAGNRDLVVWMREFNAGRAPADRVRFAGFDGPLEIAAAESPRAALVGLVGYLTDVGDADLLPCSADDLDRLLGADDRWTNPDAMMDPAVSVGRSPQAGELRLIADELACQLDVQAPALISASSERWERARMRGRTAVGLLRYHHAMADPTPQRMQRLCAQRDALMAANLLALADRGRTFVYAHNSHLQRPLSRMQMWQGPVQWWSAGAIVAARIGHDYAYLATALGALPEHGIDSAPPDTVEGILSRHRADRVLLDPGRFAEAIGDTVLRPRESPWFGYAPFDPAHLDSIDGLVFLDP